MEARFGIFISSLPFWKIKRCGVVFFGFGGIIMAIEEMTGLNIDDGEEEALALSIEVGS